jgi:hypothetical protein
VTIDDRLPCSKSGALLFGSCRDTAEFWVALLEKAYAKLHGSYQALVSGKTTDALVDFTGEGSESLDISKTEEFWKTLNNNMAESFLMGCARHAEGTSGEKPTPHGLVWNHAYGVLKCAEDAGTRLVCLRNPWGQFEWKGYGVFLFGQFECFVSQLFNHLDAGQMDQLNGSHIQSSPRRWATLTSTMELSG